MLAITKEKPVVSQVPSKVPLLQKCLDFRNWDPGPYTTLNREVLRESGMSEYEDLSSYETDGLQVLSHKKIPQSTLKLMRQGKVGATAGAVALNFASALGLFYSGGQLLFNTMAGNDVSDSYKKLGNAYSTSAVAGFLTGAAHESPEWSIGNLGMGLFGRKLDNLWGLAGFSVSEGLSSIGMGRVRYRDKRNVYAVRNSIFNNDALTKLRFLMPIEQAVLSFFKKAFSPKDWSRFVKEEPYSLFQSAGGGLITAGKALGIGSLFKNKLSEKMQSFFYLPYSAFSLLNLLALYRDGEMVLSREKNFGGRKLGEALSMKAEGQCKRLATPFLAFNNLLLGLKGLGIDTEGGMLYNVAMAARSWGAGIAYLAFQSQSMLKFFKPDLFGPLYKEKVEIKLNPLKESRVVFKHIANLEKHRPPQHQSDKFDPIIYDIDNEQRDILDALINTPTFQSLKNKTQVGLPTPTNLPINNRPYLERYTHSKRVCAIGILIYNALLRNTKDAELKKYLLENKEAFKITPLLHDIGHIARSHLAEKAIKGHDNDEYTVEILKGTGENVPKDIYQTVISYYGKERGEKILSQAREIIGKWSPLFKAYKIADYTEYIRCGDFNCVKDFPRWDIDDLKEYVDNVRLYRSKDGKIKTCFTEKGAVLTFILLFDRKVFNDAYNYFPISSADELPYLLGLDAADVSEKEIKTMTEKEVDDHAKEGLKKLKNSNFQFLSRYVTGGEAAYCGYSQTEPEKKLLVYMGKDKEPMEFIEYMEKYIKSSNPKLYEDLKPRVTGLTTPKEIDLTINVSDH